MLIKKWKRSLALVTLLTFIFNICSPIAFAAGNGWGEAGPANLELGTNIKGILTNNNKYNASMLINQGIDLVKVNQDKILSHNDNTKKEEKVENVISEDYESKAKKYKNFDVNELINFINSEKDKSFLHGDRINNIELLLACNELSNRVIYTIEKQKDLAVQTKNDLIQGVTDLIQADYLLSKTAVTDAEMVFETLYPKAELTKTEEDKEEKETSKINKSREEVKKASLELDKGNERIKKGNGKDAIHKYLKAWVHANNLLKIQGIEYRGDSDHDTLPDYIELSVGANPLLEDSDGDGLSDTYEIIHLLVNCSPNNKDTNGNGILDGDEDNDQDGLTNIEEMKIGTNPLKADTDDDELKDGFEVNTSKSNPLKSDEDNDKLSDDGEFKFHTNPKNPDTDGDGILDGDEEYTSIVNNAQLKVTVEITGQGDIGKKASIKSIENEYSYDQEVPGIIGTPVSIEADKTFKEAVIQLPIPDNISSQIDKNNLKIFYFDEEKRTFLPLEDQKVDLEKNSVIAKTTHFTEFCIIDTGAWAEAWRGELNKGRGRNDIVFLDLALTLDSSGSMYWNDPYDLRKYAAKNFVDALLPQDRVAVVDFDSSAWLLQPLTTDHEAAKQSIDWIDSWGGTDIRDGMQVANRELINNGLANNKKIEILLTDGQGTYDEKFTQEAIKNNITIYTIGLGDSVDAPLLTHIAQATGGKYYAVQVSAELQDIFNRIAEETNGPDNDGDGLPDKAEIDGMRVGDGRLIKTDPYDDDTDDDGLPDGDEIGTIGATYYGEYYTMISDPRIADTDGDSVYDNEEDDHGTNPLRMDSDYDRLTDGFELRHDYNPLDDNPDGDYRDDAAEYNKGTDPFVYDKDGLENAQDFLLGAVLGDAGETLEKWGTISHETTSSIYFMSGWIASGLIGIGDIRDTVASIVRLDLWDSLLNAFGLVPLLGDGEKTVKVIATFVAKNLDELPLVLKWCIHNLKESPMVLALAVNRITGGAYDTIKRLGAKSDDIEQLLKAGNKINKLTELGVKFASKHVDISEIDAIIKSKWPANLNPRRYAQAVGVESAVKHYESLGYEMLFVGRGQGITKGPDIIAKKGDDVLIIEAKGTAKGTVLNAGKGKGYWLGAKLGDLNTMELTKEWLVKDADDRYLNRLLDVNSPAEWQKAGELMSKIISNEISYKTAVVYAGTPGASLNYGRGLDQFAEAVTQHASNLEFVKVNAY